LSFHYIKKIFHFFGMAIAFVLTLYSWRFTCQLLAGTRMQTGERALCLMWW
jgi:hypothetical protein